jgi:hypothetical protein
LTIKSNKALIPRMPARTKATEKAKKAAKQKREKAYENALMRSRAVSMLNQGIIRARIAEQLGVTPATVTRWLKESGIEPVSKQPCPDTLGLEAPTFTDIPLTFEDDPGPDEFEEALEQSLDGSAEHPLLAARDEEEQGIMAVAENQSTPADKYQAFVAAQAIRMFRDSMPHIRGPRTVKEMSELDQMIRRNLGLNPRGGSGGAGTLQIDISILNNTKADVGGSAIPQRVYEAEIIDNNEEDEDE